MPHALNRCCNLFQGKEKQQSMPFISDLILCWRRRRSGDCHSGASRWICQSRSCSLSRLWPSRRSLRLPLQHQFQTTTHLRRETLKKTFSALRKPSPIYENLVRLNSQSHGVGRLQGTGSQLCNLSSRKNLLIPLQIGTCFCHSHGWLLWMQHVYFQPLQTCIMK